MTTLVPYQPANGVNTSVGQVQARDLLIVGSSVGKPGVVSGVLFNDHGPAVTVELSLAGGGTPVSVTIPAGDSVRLGAAGGATSGATTPGASGGPTPTSTTTPGTELSAVAQLPSLPQPAGAVVTMQLRTSTGAQTSVVVPVLPPTFEYSTITPSGEPSMTPYPATKPSAGATSSPGTTATSSPTTT